MRIHQNDTTDFLYKAHQFGEIIFEYVPTKPTHICIALAVAGLALVFFANVSFTTAIIVGAIVAIGLYHGRNSRIITELQTKLDSITKRIIELTKLESELKSDIKNLSEENKNLKSNVETFTEQNTKLTENVDNLKALNQKLNENNTEYSNQNVDLKENVKVLTDLNIKSEKNLSTITEQNSQLKSHVQSLLEQNRKLDTSVTGLEKEAAVLHTHVSNLRGIVETAQKALQEFQEERKRFESVGDVIEEGSKRSVEMTTDALKKIADQLEVSKKLSTTVSEYLRGEVKEGVYQLNRAIKEATTDNFLKTAHALTEAKQELTAVSEQINSAKKLLSKELEEYEKLRKRFEATERELADRTVQLERMANKVEDTIDKQILVQEIISRGISPYASPCKIHSGFAGIREPIC